MPVRQSGVSHLKSIKAGGRHYEMIRPTLHLARTALLGIKNRFGYAGKNGSSVLQSGAMHNQFSRQFTKAL